MTEIQVRYYFESKEKKDAYIAALKENRIPERTLDEAGCVCYEFSCPILTDTEVCLLEQWKDAEALKEHQLMPHFLELQDIKKQLVQRVELVKFSVERM